MPLALESQQIVPFIGVVASIAWQIYKQPLVNPDVELHVLPWLAQIFAALAFLNYALFMKDVFLYIQFMPVIVAGIYITMMHHPYLRKRVRRSHETIALVAFAFITLVTASTSVSPYLDQSVGRYALGSLSMLMSLGWLISHALESYRIAFQLPEGISPPLSEYASALLGITTGCLWAAYGYFYDNQDYFVYVPSLAWAAVCLGQLVLYIISATRSGGIYLGWDTEDEDDDATVDRLNRMSTLSSINTSTLKERTPSIHSNNGGGRPRSVRSNSVRRQPTYSDDKFAEDAPVAVSSGGFAVVTSSSDRAPEPPTRYRPSSAQQDIELAQA